MKCISNLCENSFKVNTTPVLFLFYYFQTEWKKSYYYTDLKAWRFTFRYLTFNNEHIHLPHGFYYITCISMVATYTQKQPNSTNEVGSKANIRSSLLLELNCETEGRRELRKQENKSIF